MAIQPYTVDTQQLAAGAGLTSYQIGFPARYIIVDNPSSFYFYEKDLDWWVGPFTMGACRRWLPPVTQSRASYRSDLLPAGSVALQPAVTEAIRVTFTDEPHIETEGTSISPGASVNTWQANSSVQLGSVAYVQASFVLTNFVLPTGSSSVTWDSKGPATNRGPTYPNFEIKIVGHQSGIVYLDSFFDAGATRLRGVAALDANDLSVDVYYTGPQGTIPAISAALIGAIIAALSVVQSVAAAAPNLAGKLTNVSVTNVAAALPAAALTNRKAVRVSVPSSGSQPVYVGYSSGVLAGAPVAGQAQGVAVWPGQSQSFGIGPGILLYGVVAAGAAVVQVEEVA